MYRRNSTGFTIVELLIVIVVIAILAVIVIIAYNGFTQRATESSLQSELKQIAKKIEVDKQTSGDESYPPGGSGNAPPAGVKAGSRTTLQYSSSGSGSDSLYCVTATQGKISYFISNSISKPQAGVCEGHNDPSSVSVPFTLTWNFDNDSTSAVSSSGAIGGGAISKSAAISNMSRIDYSDVGTVPSYEFRGANDTDTLAKALANQSFYTFPISTQATNWKIDSVEYKAQRTGSSGPRGVSVTLAGDTSMAAANDALLDSTTPMPTYTTGGFSGLSGNQALRLYVYSFYGPAGVRVDDIVIRGTYQQAQ